MKKKNVIQLVFTVGMLNLIFGMGDEMTVRFDEIPERGYSLQAYHDFSLGAVRMDPKKMVVIPCHKGTDAS